MVKHESIKETFRVIVQGYKDGSEIIISLELSHVANSKLRGLETTRGDTASTIATLNF